MSCSQICSYFLLSSVHGPPLSVGWIMEVWVTAGWVVINNYSKHYILCNEELSDLYPLPNIVWVVKLRRMRWAGHVVPMGEGRGVHRVLVGRPYGKRPFGRPRRRWEDNIKMDLQELGVVGTGCSWLRIGTGGEHL